MKRLSLQWRITLMSVLLIGITCVAMNLLLCSSGVYYMDTIADSLQGGGTVIPNDGGAASFDPQLLAPNAVFRGASRCAAGDGGIPHAFARADGAADADDQDAAGDEQFAAGGAERADPARSHDRGDLHRSCAALR